MEILELHRRDKREDGVFGQIFRAGHQICVTCEDPDKNNAPGESCIPVGDYICIPHDTPKYPDVWEVSGVPGRAAILIHNGNIEDDTRGCILVGDTYGEVNGKHAVLNSKPTLAKLRLELPRTFILKISEVL